jgi:hypothetical protein
MTNNTAIVVALLTVAGVSFGIAAWGNTSSTSSTSSSSHALGDLPVCGAWAGLGPNFNGYKAQVPCWYTVTLEGVRLPEDNQIYSLAAGTLPSSRSAQGQLDMCRADVHSTLQGAYSCYETATYKKCDDLENACGTNSTDGWTACPTGWGCVQCPANATLMACKQLPAPAAMTVDLKIWVDSSCSGTPTVDDMFRNVGATCSKGDLTAALKYTGSSCTSGGRLSLYTSNTCAGTFDTMDVPAGESVQPCTATDDGYFYSFSCAQTTPVHSLGAP